MLATKFVNTGFEEGILSDMSFENAQCTYSVYSSEQCTWKFSEFVIWSWCI